jgi:hypothetical protein
MLQAQRRTAGRKHTRLTPHLNEWCWEPVVVVRLGQSVLHHLLQDAGQAGDEGPAAAATRNTVTSVKA